MEAEESGPTDKQARVWEYFEKEHIIQQGEYRLPTVAIMSKELGMSTSYINDLKLEWLEEKALTDREKMEWQTFASSLI
jgi:hypothetical protein